MQRMIGILITLVGSAFNELSDTIGKRKMSDGMESYYTFGFLNLLFSTLFLVYIGAWRHDLLFSLSSLPTFIPRLFLEIAQAHVSILAVTKADRSDFGPIRVLTVPLLLLVDIALGYAITTNQMIGIGIIVLTIFILLFHERFHTKGFLLILFTAVNAVATISLYKYDISHFNSVESEQVIIQLVLLLYFFILAVTRGYENPLTFLRRPAFLVQAIASSFAPTIGSFAYLFAPASVITAALRAFIVLFSILSGNFYFKENGFFFKSFIFLGILLGVILLL